MAEQTETGTEWVTVAEAAAQLGLVPVTLRKAARVGHLEARRSGKVWLTTQAAVRAWLKEAAHRPGRRPRRQAASPTE